MSFGVMLFTNKQTAFNKHCPRQPVADVSVTKGTNNTGRPTTFNVLLTFNYYSGLVVDYKFGVQVKPEV